MLYPTLKIDFPTRASTGAPVALRVLQREFMHDIAVVTIRNETAKGSQFRTGSPVHIQWGYSPKNLEDFYGYVNHVDGHIVSGISNVDVVCIGASFYMKNENLRVLRNLSAPLVAKKVLSSYGLASVISPSARALGSISQSSQSDWAFLSNLAKEEGFTFFVNKTTGYFADRLSLVNERFTTAPTYSPQSSTHHLFSFDPIIGETAPEGGTKAFRVAYGIDPRTLQEVGATSKTSVKRPFGTTSETPLFTSYATQNVHSLGEASSTLDSVQKGNRFHIQAKADVSGSAKLRQGSTVVINGVDKLNDGLWYVHDVEHTIKNRQYRTLLVLGRDSYGDSGFRASATRPPALSSGGSSRVRRVGNVWKSG